MLCDFQFLAHICLLKKKKTFASNLALWQRTQHKPYKLKIMQRTANWKCADVIKKQTASVEFLRKSKLRATCTSYDFILCGNVLEFFIRSSTRGVRSFLKQHYFADTARPTNTPHGIPKCRAHTFVFPLPSTIAHKKSLIPKEVAAAAPSKWYNSEHMHCIYIREYIRTGIWKRHYSYHQETSWWI